jgi:hypothetical protein
MAKKKKKTSSKNAKSPKKKSSAQEPEPEPEQEPEPELLRDLSQAAAELLEKARTSQLALASKTVDDCYTIEGREAIIARVAANDAREIAIDWSYKDVTDTEAQALLAALPGNAHVRRLDFKGNKQLTEESGQLALAVLPHSGVARASFEYCDGMHNDEPRSGVSSGLREAINVALIPNILAEVRDSDAGLTELDLHAVGLREEHMEQVAEALEQSTQIQRVRVGGNAELTDAGLRIMLTALPQCLSVTHVDLSSQQLLNTTLTDAGVEPLLVVIPLCAVTEVDLRYCDKVSWELKTAIATAIEARLQQEEADRIAAEAAEAERIRLTAICPDCEPGGTGPYCEPHGRVRAVAAAEAAQAAMREAEEERQQAEERAADARKAQEREEEEAQEAAAAAAKEEEEAREAEERARQELAEAEAAAEKLAQEEAEALAAEDGARKEQDDVALAELALAEAKKMKKGKERKKAVAAATANLERERAEAETARQQAEQERLEADAARVEVERERAEAVAALELAEKERKEAEAAKLAAQKEQEEADVARAETDALVAQEAEARRRAEEAAAANQAALELLQPPEPEAPPEPESKLESEPGIDNVPAQEQPQPQQQLTFAQVAKSRQLARRIKLQRQQRGGTAGEAEQEEEAADKVETGRLIITIIECKDLKDKDGGRSNTKGSEKQSGWGKKNDVYVVVRIGAGETLSKRTRTIDEGGANPVWSNEDGGAGGGEGEALVFEVDAAEICNTTTDPPTAGEIRLDCMDDDSDEIIKATGEVKADDFIGATQMSFVNSPVGKKWNLPDQWCDLKDERGKRSGRIHVSVSWTPAEVLAAIAAVQVELRQIYQAHNPAKLDSVDALLGEWSGQEQQLLRNVQEKYGLLPEGDIPPA